MSLAGLRESIERVGIINPLTVVSRPEGGLSVIAGHRRLEAAMMAGLDEVPIRRVTTDSADDVAVIENLQREDLHPLDEAEAYRKLMNGKAGNAAVIAARVGKFPRHVWDRLRLLSLCKEAQQLFRDGRIQLGHAILLARISVDAQKRAIDPDTTGVWSYEALLFAPDYEPDRTERKREGMKVCTPTELQAWIDKHVKLNPTDEVTAELFPHTSEVALSIKKNERPFVPITHDHFVQPDARDGSKIVGPRSWRLVKKPCEHAVMGVLMIGPDRGEAFSVCIAKKKCRTHWGTEIRERTKREKEATKEGSTGERREKIKERLVDEGRAKAEAAKKRYDGCVKHVVKLLAEKILVAPTDIHGLLAKVIIDAVVGYGWRPKFEESKNTDAQEVVRRAAFIVLAHEANQYQAYSTFPKRAKKLGIDVRAILNEHWPLPTSAEMRFQRHRKVQKKKAARKSKPGKSTK
jgi:ParB/RepB/Spo0J family partition protein